MDLLNMDKTPLNMAHQLERRAEQLNKKQKFDECIQCHKQATECLSKLLSTTTNPVSLDSIKRQKEYHERQIETVELKKQYFAKMQKQNQNSELKNLDSMENLQNRIFRTMETHDSLIYYLGKRDKDGLDSMLPVTIEKNEDNTSDVTTVSGNKHPKDDAQVIEELKVLSNQLRESIRGLLLELDDRNKEIASLKEKVRVLESEKESTKKNETNNESPFLKIAADSSGGTSPYVVTPLNELMQFPPFKFDPSMMKCLDSSPDVEFLNMKFDKLSSLSSSSSNGEDTSKKENE